MFSKLFIHVAACWVFPFYGWIMHHCRNIKYIFVIHSSISDTEVFIIFWLVWLTLQWTWSADILPKILPSPLGYIPRGGIGRLYNSCIFNDSEGMWYCCAFHFAPLFYRPTNSVQDFSFPDAYQHFLFSSSNLTKCKVIAHYSFHLNFPDY